MRSQKRIPRSLVRTRFLLRSGTPVRRSTFLLVASIFSQLFDPSIEGARMRADASVAKRNVTLISRRRTEGAVDCESQVPFLILSILALH